MYTWISGFFGLVDLLVVCGNCFVLYILASQPQMRTATNRLVLSLTLADLLLGVVILPFSMMQEHHSSWQYGQVWCNMWQSLDVWFSTASIYSLLAISFDRYMAVRQPIRYPIISSTKVIRLMIFLVWGLSGLLATSLLVILHTTPNAMPPAHGMCIPMNIPFIYVIVSGFASFAIPMISMVVLNVLILRTVYTTQRSRCVSVNNTGVSMRIHRGKTSKCKESRDEFAKKISTSTTCKFSCDESGLQKMSVADYPTINHDLPRSQESLDQMGASPALKTFMSHVMVVSMVAQNKRKKTLINSLSRTNRTRFSRLSMRTELRVARTTAVVVGVFILCWLPFALIYMLQASGCSIDNHCIPSWIFTTAFWLGYSNSAVNPLLYAAFSRDFRAAARKVLHKSYRPHK